MNLKKKLINIITIRLLNKIELEENLLNCSLFKFKIKYDLNSNYHVDGNLSNVFLSDPFFWLYTCIHRLYTKTLAPFRIRIFCVSIKKHCVGKRYYSFYKQTSPIFLFYLKSYDVSILI